MRKIMSVLISSGGIKIIGTEPAEVMGNSGENITRKTSKAS